MSFAFRMSLCLLTLGLNLSGPALALPQSTPSAPFEEASLRVVVEEYFSAYGKKDLAGVVALWSESSPSLATYKQSLEQQLASEDLSFGRSAISRVKMESGKASLRVTIALTSINRKNQQKSEQRLARIFEFIREGKQWKVWRYAPAAEDLARALAKADNEAERTGLLAEEKELVGVELGRALLTQGEQLISQGDYKRAIEIYKLTSEIAQQLNDKDIIAIAIRGIGNAQRLQGNSSQALEQYQKSLKISEEISNKIEIAKALQNIGVVQCSRGDYIEALESFHKGLRMLEEIGDKLGLAIVLNNIGYVQNSQGNITEALEQYRKCLKISEEIGDKPGIAITLYNIGNAYREQSNYAEALEQYQKSLKISEEIGDRFVAAGALSNIGNVHYFQGDYAQALEQHRKSLKIMEEIGNKAGIASTLNNIGLVYQLQGNYTEALEQHRNGLKISEEIGDKPAVAGTLNNIGSAYQLQGDYTEALEQYQKGLKIKEEIGDKAGIAASLSNIGETHRLQGNYTEALQFAERAADLARQVGLLEPLSGAYTTAGRAYFTLNQLSQSRLALDQAITIIETLRFQVAGGEQERQRFFESKISPYYAMVELLIAQNNPGEALSYAERARARVLLDVLSSGRVSVTKAMTGLEIEQEGKLKSRLVALNTQISREQQREQADQNRLSQLGSLLQEARLDFEDFETRLYNSHPKLKPQRGEAPVIKAEELAALLPDSRSALLEYVVTDDHTYLFAITKAAGKAGVEVRVYALTIKRADLTKQIESFREQLAGRDLGFRAPARRLYQSLLKPAEAQLQGKTNLIIVPDDKLWELPFQGLIAGGDRYVIENSAVSYAPSLTVLREMKAQRNKHGVNEAGLNLLALGNPAIGRETLEHEPLALRGAKLGPLPAAEQEVKALGQVYGAAHSKIYIGPEACEDRVKTEAGQAGVLHFATHGILNDTEPMYSHLVLAQGDQNEDGLLEAWELMRLDLKAHLAVLSACETARGRFGAGEGVIGLTWAMFVAGVPTTLVSQWKVESASTRDLMLNFHRQLKAPSAVARATVMAESWRQAALKLMKNPATSHPFYWAGFVLVGDDR
ncbi:MAG TPA: CHAT domain-containing tetratricopeptide repeat protein [Blastocatellia bacterium]|nr:CHAT domain-containing tetratricopeptide repeat protein [Blastocatellia bacterium]